jgi:hypothetical protein
MKRYINLGDGKGKNAEIVFSGKTKKSLVKLVTENGEPVKTLRVVKGTIENAYDNILKSAGNDESVAKSILEGDPEINHEFTGRFVGITSKVYIDSNSQPVFWIRKKEKVFLPDGTLKEERDQKETFANILSAHPIRPVGKMLSRKEMASKLVFGKKYQLHHTNGLTFDFMMGMAKELAENDSLIMISGGAKGNEPIVFQDGGKAYRAFLEGRIGKGGYILLLHLSNLELKGVKL